MHSLFEKTADFRHSPKAEAKYGPVGLWDVSKVTSMGELFMGCINFNEDISAWDVRCTESLCYNHVRLRLELQPCNRSVPGMYGGPRT